MSRNVNPARLLDDLVRTITTYVVFPSSHEPVAIALWAMHTWVFDDFETCPYLLISSAEKRSGKSRLLDVLEQIVRDPWRCVRPSEAVFYRKIHRDQPTVLLDEHDTLWGRGANEHEGLRSALNAGNRRGTSVPRCSGKDMQIIDFSVFCPKALAGIGDVPDTIADRSIPIRLKRRSAGETVKKFRSRQVAGEFEDLRSRLEAWAAEVSAKQMLAQEAVVPEELTDRAADAWEPLFSIADDAGMVWPHTARAAAIALHRSQESDASLGIRLLADLYAIFGGKEEMPTHNVLEELQKLDESPWRDWNHGKGLTPKKLADLLRPYGVKSRSDGTERGYRRADLEDPWSRYPVFSSEEGGQSVNASADSTPDALTDRAAFMGSEEEPSPLLPFARAGVTVLLDADGNLTCDPPPCDLSPELFALLTHERARLCAALKAGR